MGLSVPTFVRRFPRAEAGVAAVEFAFVLPVMLVLFYGLSETGLALSADRKITTLTHTMAGIAAKEPQLSTNDVATIFSAASAMMRPFSGDDTQMVLFSVLVTKTGNTYTGSVDWSCDKNIPASGPGVTRLTKPAKKSSYPVPDEFKTDGTKSFIVVDALYPYTSPFGKMIVGTMNMRETTTWPVTAYSKESSKDGIVAGPSSCPSS